MSTRKPSKRPTPAERYNKPQPLYFLETFGRQGDRWFIEVDRDSNSRAFVLELMRTKERDAAKVIEVIEPCEDFPQGAVRDVTLELQLEASAMAEVA